MYCGKDLIEKGYPEGFALGKALEILNQEKEELALSKLVQESEMVLANPQSYLDNETWSIVANALITADKKSTINDRLKDEALPYKIYGAEGIEIGALEQMDLAMRLSVTHSGALMPDAHHGYGLPIGGVLATKNSIIPYGVGVDIGCRMCMTIYDIPVEVLDTNRSKMKKYLKNSTCFGQKTFRQPKDHEVMSNPLFEELDLLRGLKDRAAKQMGSSGGGNHFVEFGIATITDVNNEWNLEPGQYLAVLSHSGSRGLGANIARHYTQLAKKICPLPSQVQHLAWMDLDTEAGQEYWLAMNLAGDYASACHHQIHDRLARAIGGTRLAMIENHHNFAWKEKDEFGNEIVVHRKGATPAGKDVLGIIPGSMTAPGFIVRGKGNVASINSASHGAGRQMSRTKANHTLNLADVQSHLIDAGVEVIGSGLDEAPMAYKDIFKVMEAQQELVDVVGQFHPKIVRMCGDEKFYQH